MDSFEIIAFIIGLFSIIASLIIIIIYALVKEVRTNPMIFYIIALSILDILIVISSTPYIGIYSYSNLECYTMSVLSTFALIASALVNFCIIEIIYTGLEEEPKKGLVEEITIGKIEEITTISTIEELPSSTVETEKEALLLFIFFYAIIGSVGPIWTDNLVIQPGACYISYEADTFSFIWIWIDILIPLSVVFIFLAVAFLKNACARKDVLMFLMPGIFFICNLGILIDGILQLWGIFSSELENIHILTRNLQGLFISIFYAKSAFVKVTFKSLKDSFRFNKNDSNSILL